MFLVTDTNNDVIESDEANNSGQGHLIDSDNITYFAWDHNGNGVVEPLDALALIQAIGTDDAAGDLNGDGIVSPLEALSAAKRIGYLRADVLSKTGTVKIASSVFEPSVAGPEFSGAGSGKSNSSSEAKSTTATVNVDTSNPKFANVTDDQGEEDSLFSVESYERPVMVAPANDDPETDSDPFTTIEWLDVI